MPNHVKKSKSCRASVYQKWGTKKDFVSKRETWFLVHESSLVWRMRLLKKKKKMWDDNWGHLIIWEWLDTSYNRGTIGRQKLSPNYLTSKHCVESTVKKKRQETSVKYPKKSKYSSSLSHRNSAIYELPIPSKQPTRTISNLVPCVFLKNDVVRRTILQLSRTTCLKAMLREHDPFPSLISNLMGLLPVPFSIHYQLATGTWKPP